MEFVLVRLCRKVSADNLGLQWTSSYLQVSKLSKLLAAVVKLACEWLDLLVHDLVRSDIPTLCECFATYVTLVRPLTGMASFVCLVWISTC